MIKGKVVYIILGIVVVTAIILRVVQFFNKDDYSKKIIEEPKKVVADIVTDDLDDQQTFVLEGKETASTSISNTEIVIGSKLAVITEPQSSSFISSPLVVKGEAPGAWFFEASFPVKLLDGDGNIIVTEPAIAQSDPLTENFVPYKTLLEFNTTATSGYLVLTNDNPSGLPEYELSVKIPVLFLNK